MGYGGNLRYDWNDSGLVFALDDGYETWASGWRFVFGYACDSPLHSGGCGFFLLSYYWMIVGVLGIFFATN